jgi:SAM-dependent methyltransferase
LIERAKKSFNYDFFDGDFTNFNFGNQKFDIITCLSVTKWIHVHHGDNGIEDLFRKIHDLLIKDGVLILEPQVKFLLNIKDWISYTKLYKK